MKKFDGNTIQVADVIRECMNDTKKGRDGSILLYDKIRLKYPNKHKLYEQIVDILTQCWRIATRKTYTMDTGHYDNYVVSKFCYKAREYDKIYFTIKNGKILFINDYEKALALSDYLVHFKGDLDFSDAKISTKSELMNSKHKWGYIDFDCELDFSDAKIFTKSELMNSKYRWGYVGYCHFVDMLGSKGRIYKADREVSYKFEGKLFSEVNIEALLKI